jgi:hypothetical protein
MTVDELNNATSEQLREYMRSIDRAIETETDPHQLRALNELWLKMKFKAEAKESKNGGTNGDILDRPYV